MEKEYVEMLEMMSREELMKVRAFLDQIRHGVGFISSKGQYMPAQDAGPPETADRNPK